MAMVEAAKMKETPTMKWMWPYFVGCLFKIIGNIPNVINLVLDVKGREVWISMSNAV